MGSWTHQLGLHRPFCWQRIPGLAEIACLRTLFVILDYFWTNIILFYHFKSIACLTLTGPLHCWSIGLYQSFEFLLLFQDHLSHSRRGLRRVLQSWKSERTSFVLHLRIDFRMMKLVVNFEIPLSVSYFLGTRASWPSLFELNLQCSFAHLSCSHCLEPGCCSIWLAFDFKIATILVCCRLASWRRFRTGCKC